MVDTEKVDSVSRVPSHLPVVPRERPKITSAPESTPQKSKQDANWRDWWYFSSMARKGEEVTPPTKEMQELDSRKSASGPIGYYDDSIGKKTADSFRDFVNMTAVSQVQAKKTMEEVQEPETSGNFVYGAVDKTKSFFTSVWNYFFGSKADELTEVPLDPEKAKQLQNVIDAMKQMIQQMNGIVEEMGDTVNFDEILLFMIRAKEKDEGATFKERMLTQYNQRKALNKERKQVIEKEHDARKTKELSDRLDKLVSAAQLVGTCLSVVSTGGTATIAVKVVLAVSTAFLIDSVANDFVKNKISEAIGRGDLDTERTSMSYMRGAIGLFSIGATLYYSSNKVGAFTAIGNTFKAASLSVSGYATKKEGDSKHAVEKANHDVTTVDDKFQGSQKAMEQLIKAMHNLWRQLPESEKNKLEAMISIFRP